MSNVIDFPTGLRERTIESIPQVHPRQPYRFHVGDREISVYFSAVLGEWRWRTEDCRWWDDRFFGSGVGFSTAAEAQQDAINRVAAMNGKPPLFRQVIGLVKAYDAAMGYKKAEGEV